MNTTHIFTFKKEHIPMMEKIVNLLKSEGWQLYKRDEEYKNNELDSVQVWLTRTFDGE